MTRRSLKMQAPRQMQVTDFIDSGGFIQCPVSAFAEFRQATPAVLEETLGGRVMLLMCRPQSHDAVGDAPNGARVMNRDLPRVNCS